jgi:hypothetical protein
MSECMSRTDIIEEVGSVGRTKTVHKYKYSTIINVIDFGNCLLMVIARRFIWHFRNRA